MDHPGIALGLSLDCWRSGATAAPSLESALHVWLREGRFLLPVPQRALCWGLSQRWSHTWPQVLVAAGEVGGRWSLG